MPLQRSKPFVSDIESNFVNHDAAPGKVEPALPMAGRGSQSKGSKKRREIPLLSMRLRSSDNRDANVASVTESSLSALLQPIFALFPPTQSAAPLAPAFDVKPSNSPKEKQIPINNDVKSKPLTGGDDDFVIYQPSSWTAKRRKPSAATVAYSLDWRTDPFGESPVEVRGQRTKHPKLPPLPPPPRRFPPRNIKLPGELGLYLGKKNGWGSLASVSEISFASFGSGGSSSNFHELVTPLRDEFDLGLGMTRVDTASILTREDEMDSVGIELASPTRPLREELAKLHMQSPLDSNLPTEVQEDKDDDKMESPHTPLTPRSVPDSDDDSD